MASTTPPVRGNYQPHTPTVRSFYNARLHFLDGTGTPSDDLARCFAAIDKRESQLQAWVTLNREVATREAEAASNRYRAGDPLSALDGMPVGIKAVI
jgi:Asp-tRNA(Asn)/Glu-tRNA(Gln) amidotransferase A subunit family amidase